MLVGTYGPLGLECQPRDYYFSPDVLFSAERVPFVPGVRRPRAAVGSRSDVEHSLGETKSDACNLWEQIKFEP